MNKTKIEWCDSTWNPVTGCLHDCEYCYARKIANRFGGASETHYNECVGTEMQWETEDTGELHALEEPIYDPDGGKNAPYPYYFDPTLLKYRLGIPQKWSKSRNIFVCSMADLFGDWVPDEWIDEVMKACANAPQHNYLFLTKNPKRYESFCTQKLPDNIWLGTTITDNCDLVNRGYDLYEATAGSGDKDLVNRFLSIEPLLGEINDEQIKNVQYFKWIIIGAESGNRKNKVIPEKAWIDSIVKRCDFSGVPVFMKDSLVSIIGEENMRREFPKELKKS